MITFLYYFKTRPSHNLSRGVLHIAPLRLEVKWSYRTY